MNEQRKFHEFVFSPDFSSARHSDGTEIVFTRTESDILRVLSQHPGQILTRNQLLDAVSGEGSEKSDRNIDYVISRIRRKLSDDPKAPEFIVTRYGEGYKWLPHAATTRHANADVAVGPLRGIEGIGRFAPLARLFADEFYAVVEDDLPEGRTATFIPEEGATFGTPFGREVNIEMTFFTDADELECILTARRASTETVLAVARRPLGTAVNPGRVRQDARAAAQVLLGQMWRSLVALQQDAPLPVAMHEAAGMPAATGGSWPRNDTRLKHLLAETPDDPALKLLYATHLHSKYILEGPELFRNGLDTCRADEDQIEDLVLSALPSLRGDPSQTIIVAKLLHFIDRGYRALAIEMAETSLKKSTSIASSLAVVGQMRSFSGRTEEAISSLDQAALLSTYGSEFHVYALFMKCQALAAAGDWAGLAEARKRMYKVRPAAMIFEHLFGDPFRPSLRARALGMALSRGRAEGLLKQCNYVSTRLYEREDMRENSIRSLLGLLIGRFGESVVPDEMRQSVPRLVSQLANRRR